MSENDFYGFASRLDAVYAVYGKSVPAETKARFFSFLARFSLEEVQTAMAAHVLDTSRGQFPPKPADLIAQIEGHTANDGRPGGDEAWAIAIRSCDENETVETTPEIMEALAITRPVLALGDKVGARKSFLEIYSRLVAEARSAGRPVAWTLSLGWDQAQRETAVRDATASGRLQTSFAALLLPPATKSEPMTPATTANRAQLKAVLATLSPGSKRARHTAEARSAAERERLAEKKNIMAKKVQQYRPEAGGKDSSSC